MFDECRSQPGFPRCFFLDWTSQDVLDDNTGLNVGTRLDNSFVLCCGTPMANDDNMGNSMEGTVI
jgi:hypothetical protein